MKKHLWAICFTLALAAFTTYIALDTFVLSSNYKTNATEMNTSMFAQTPAAETERVLPEEQTEAPMEAQPEVLPVQVETGDAPADEPAAADSGDGTSDESSDEPAQTQSDSASGEPARSERSSSRNSGSTDSSSAWFRSGSDWSSSWGGRSGDDDDDDSGDSSGWSAWGNDRNDDDADSDWGGSSGRSGWDGWDDRSDRSGWSDQSGWSGWGGNYMNTAESAEGVDAAAEYTGDMTYKDDNVTVTLTEYEQYDTKIYVADVVVSSTQYIKAAFAKDTYGKNVTESTSAMAASHDAILAVNGDYYGAQERGYVIRNGIVYRDSAAGEDVMCIYADGTMGIVSDRKYTADELVANGVWQAFTFGPALVEDGEVAVSRNSRTGQGTVSNPRTAVGMLGVNHFVFVVADGRSGESEGLTLYELAKFMQSLGVETAYNLDGGGSTTMYFNGQVVNNPTSWSGTGIKERGVSDIVYVG